jgi:ABC-type multidrug transport system fused ATPase/permease subunit
MNDARAIEGALIRTLVSIVIDGLTFLVGMTMIIYLRYELGLLMLAFLLPFAYVRYFANEKMRVLSAQMQETQAVTSAVISESFSGVRTIKAYVRESFQDGVIEKRLKDLQQIYLKTNWFGIISSVSASLLTSMCIAFVLWYGCRSVIAGTMTLGQVVAILSLLSFLYGPINNFVATNLKIQQSAAAIQRIYEFLGRDAEPQTGRALSIGRGRIEFQNVSFAYQAGNEVLKDVTFAIEPGSVVALAGRTGAGKSTLVNLLMRFYEVGSGRMTLDGTDLREFSLASLRNQIGIVDQQAFLFSGSIVDNIRFGKPEATFDEIVAASKLSYADEFIEKLPDGYNTRVGERGVRLSGGQCQRIALARMFLKDPKILILDEAVSAIDSESESYIQQALVPLVENRTTIVIAHRLSSLLLADNVIVLDQGAVVEQGSHRILMDANGPYSRLFYEQFKGQLNKEAPAGSAAFVS